MLDHLFAAIVIAFVLGVPGIAIGFAALHGVKLSIFEKKILGLILGVLLNPFLCFLEFIVAGIPMTAGLVLINAVIILVAGVALLHRQKQLVGPIAKAKAWLSHATNLKPDVATAKKLAVPALLLLIMAFAFYARISTAWSPTFYEFDPYYYDGVSQFIAKDGFAPLYADDAYFPQQRFHRDLPLSHYMTAQWYQLYQSILGKPFIKDEFTLTVQVYPPLVALFMVFLAFLYFKEEYNPHVGLLAAFFFAVTPQLVKKMGAGVSEQAPFGFFSAIMVFALIGLAINRKSYRLAALACFALIASLLGSSHYIWPYLIIAVFFFLKSIGEFFTNDLNLKSVKIDLMFGVSALAASLMRSIYQADAISFTSLDSGVFLVFASSLFAAGLFAIKKYHVEKQLRIRKKYVLAGFVAVCLILVLFTPLNAKVISYTNSALGFAKSSNALYKTVQEGGASNEGFFAPSYGVLGSFKIGNTAVISPYIVLGLTAILAVVSGLLSLWQKKQKKYFYGFLAISFIAIFLNSLVDDAINAIAASISDPVISSILTALTGTDIFTYTALAVLGALFSYVYSDKRSELALLSVLAIIPVAYVGLSRLKYTVHMAFVLAFATGFIFGELGKILEKLNSLFSFAKAQSVAKIAFVIVLLFGIPLAYAQYGTVQQSMAELGGSRIPTQWTSTMYWMRDNLSSQDRVMAWWDYGHWITYFAEKKTVLDPGNVYPEYDQEVAHAFVEESPLELISSMRFHGATYVMLDNELIYKWGALVFLSGTYNGSASNYQPSIPATNDPGNSEYESEHYFEQIYSVFANDEAGQIVRAQCPGVTPLPLMFSNFGALYCLDAKGLLYYLKNPQTGETVPLRGVELVPIGDDSNVALTPLGSNSNLFYNSNPRFLNIAPDLGTISEGTLHSSLGKSNFVNLYFRESLPGFTLAYKDPTGLIKVFKLTA